VTQYAADGHPQPARRGPVAQCPEQQDHGVRGHDHQEEQANEEAELRGANSRMVMVNGDSILTMVIMDRDCATVSHG
jgi:hypothetical protein